MSDQPLFFFSYAHADHSNLLELFLRDLEEEILDQWDQLPPDPPYYIDREGIKPGADWRQELKEALGRSHTMVSLFSNRYFLQEYCGKELAAFLQRQPHAELKDGRIVNSTHILPVLWIAEKDFVMPAVTEQIQYASIPNPDISLKNYIRTYLREGQWTEDYLNLITSLADQIIDLIKEQPLPVLAEDALPDLGTVPNVFAAQAAPDEVAGEEAHSSVKHKLVGPETLLAVYLWHSEAQQSPRDWCPLRPQQHLHDALLQRAARNGMDLVALETDVDVAGQVENATRALAEALATNTPVLLIANPAWATDAAYTETLKHWLGQDWNGGLLIADGEGTATDWATALRGQATDHVAAAILRAADGVPLRSRLDSLLNRINERMAIFGHIHHHPGGEGPRHRPQVHGPGHQTPAA